jgi:ankyrin repeat protein
MEERRELPKNPDEFQLRDPFEALSQAVNANDTLEVKRLLDRSPELKAKLNQPMPNFSFGRTALIGAVGNGNREMVEILLDTGADPNVRSEWWAGSFGVLDSANPELSVFLIKRGARLDVHSAARLGMLDELKELVSARPDLVHARGGDGQTPLHFAANVEIAAYLADHGADLDARDIDHESTPAQYMIQKRQDIARYLIKRGCSTDILMAAAVGDLELVRRQLERDTNVIRMSVSERWFPKQDKRSGGTIYIWTLGWNKTAHIVARDFGREAVLEFLMEKSRLPLRLAKSAELGDEREFEALLTSHPGILEALTHEDRASLANAAQDHNLKALQMMLAAGWPVNARQANEGATALHWAAWHGNSPMVAELLRYHPQLELQDGSFRKTPFEWAMHGSLHSWCRDAGDYPAVVRKLLQAGAQAPKLVHPGDASNEVLKLLRLSKESADSG